MKKYRIGSTGDFAEGKASRVEAGGMPVAVVRAGGKLYAVSDTCSHANYSLSEGEVLIEELEIECWKHGSTFSLVDGKPQCLPATKPVQVFEVIEEGGEVFLIEGSAD
jgi:3-phenylpropionate/trans-cinnamate dioxygenase ferredoxin subunit